MKTQSEQVQRWDDIIFEKRNKEYGAYVIRKDYNSNVLKAEAISLGIALMIFIFPILMMEKKIIIPVINDPIGEIKLKEFVVKPEIEAPPRSPIRRMDASIVPTHVTTQQVADEQPTQQTDEVSYTAGLESGTTKSGMENIVETGSGTIPGEIDKKPFDYVEKMPEYEGGNEAMMKFIQKKTRYPSKARIKGDQGIVFVQFVVSADGRVTNVEVVKGVSKECDEEAVRVISMMDKWKPGIQNNHPVAVRKILPIRFVLNL